MATKKRKNRKRQSLQGLTAEQKAMIKAKAQAAKEKAKAGAQKANAFLQGNPTAKKVLIWGVGGLTVFIVGRKIFNKWRDSRLDREYDNAIQSLTVNTSKTTLSDSEASSIAAGLKAAMNKVGTDEKAIDTLWAQITNADDCKLVIKKFGIQGYRNGGASTSDKARQIGLIGWLREELSGSRLKKIEAQLSEWGIKG